ncbi:thermonuclease family protein [uncultured Pseudomonas sp.]|uniref:thermonuclease family protein n=1 Tax=uncultured Pseudomonas sp. TaxID=114707 RepID=UPI0025DC6246|nr:thermonuclease family protein [uncultured Pseudomonas sp.]
MTTHLGAIARRFSLASILALSFLPLCAQAETITGKVVGISDGDTLTLLTADKRQVKVRLAEIDTPERAQPYGTRAQQQLSALAFGKQAELQVQDTDRYGRTVARVIVNGQDVNREMVREGAAWVYRAYNRDKSLLAVEADAQAQKRGLWALPEAERVAPWDWRKAGRSGQTINLAAKPAKPESGGGFSCDGGKKYCKDMSSCAEARFYLEQCGMSRLDRDKDGIPCENVCGG